MALFSQAPKVSKSVKLEETRENLAGSYTILKDENIKLYETPTPNAARASSIGSALSRHLKRGTSQNVDKV